MAEDEGSGKLGHGHDSSSELTRRRVLHSSEKTKSDRPEASKSAGKEARADINNKDVYNPCWFWTYVVSFVSILTLALLLVTQTVGLDGRAEFLTMPAAVREHYSKGRAIKAEIGIEGNPIRVYIRAQGPIEGETVVLLHGLETSSFVYRNVIENLAARKLRVIAVDMPGSGLSEKSVLREWRHPEWGLLRKCRNIYDEIMEKGIFWRMEELFETGSLPEVGNVEKVEMVETVVDYSPEELSETLEQVLGSVGVSTAHLVIHGSALEVARAWALRYTMQLQSITLIDPMPVRPSMQLLLLSIPGLGWLIPRWVSLYRLVLKSCCIRFPSQSISEAYAFLLRSQNGRNAVLEIAKKSNCSADLSLWLNENKIKQIPVQVLWASNWSKEWDQRGKNFMASVPRATFISHKGSRWPQEDAADEISNAIWKFVSSLPPSLKPSQEEQLPAHIQKLFDEMSSSGDHHGHIHSHDHGHNHAHHDHGHGAQAHGIGHGGWVM